MTKLYSLLISGLIFTSCASSYKAIQPDRIHFQNNETYQEIEFSYKYDVLNERGNKKYANKESMKSMKIVAVKVVNNSDSSFVFGKDLKVYSGGKSIRLLEPDLISSTIKQGVAVHLLYFLLTPMTVHSGGTTTPIGLVVGPGIAIDNIVTASIANKKFKKELEANYLSGSVIHAGETIYGLIGILDVGYNPLELR
jgi:hypothetical protein